MCSELTVPHREDYETDTTGYLCTFVNIRFGLGARAVHKADFRESSFDRNLILFPARDCSYFLTYLTPILLGPTWFGSSKRLPEEGKPGKHAARCRYFIVSITRESFDVAVGS